jgi:short-subunit dehydrogenase
MDPKGKIALVTGANGGIGHAIAKALHDRGATVRVSGRRADALVAVTEATNARVTVADLAIREDVTRLTDENMDVDILVLNAALPASGPIMDFSTDELDRALDVNLRAPMYMARRIGEAMVARGRGRIIAISSISGRVAVGGTSVYSATKFGMRGFFLGMHEDVKEHGVGVTTIYPGFIRDAGMFADTGVTLPKTMGTKSPEDVARATLRAVTDAPAEIDVAAFDQRAGAFIAAIAPSLAGPVSKKFGGGLAERIAQGQRGKR